MPKGIDDLLVEGGTPRRLRGNEVEAFFTHISSRFSGEPAPPTEVNGSPLPILPLRIRPDRPEFPIEVFPDAVARFCRQVAAAIGCPVDFLAVAVLVVAGAIVGASRAIRVKAGWEAARSGEDMT